MGWRKSFNRRTKRKKNLIFILLRSMKFLKIVFIISLLWTIWSMYVSSFGDPLHNLIIWDLFNSTNGALACTLCWYTRICLFPLVPISGIALYEKNTAIRKTIVPIALIWILFSFYIRWTELKIREKNEALCGINSIIPCGNPPILRWGRFTLATAWIVSFWIILRACYKISKRNK